MKKMEESRKPVRGQSRVKFTEKDLIKVTTSGLGDGNTVAEWLIFSTVIVISVLFLALVAIQGLQ